MAAKKNPTQEKDLRVQRRRDGERKVVVREKERRFLVSNFGEERQRKEGGL